MNAGIAMERLGSVAMGIGLDLAQQQRMEAQRQQQVYEASEKQRELLALQQTRDRLRDEGDTVSEEIRTGALPKEQAETAWRERASKITGEAMQKFRQGTQEFARKDLEGAALTFGNGIRKVAEQRGRSEVGAGLTTALEGYSREYRTDPAKANELAMLALRELGPAAGMSPEQIAKTGQAWREGAQFALASEALSAGRQDPNALKRAEKLIGELPDLDPQRRVQLLDRAQGYRIAQQQQAEMAAARNERIAEKRMREAAAEFDTFTKLADKGTVLSTEYIDEVTRKTAGTPYQSGVVALAEQARAAGGLAAQPINNQRAALRALDVQIATSGRTPELDKRREQVQKVLSGSEADIKDDPLWAGLQRGVVSQLEPLNLQGGIQGLVQGMARRVEQAQRVEQWAGAPVAPLLSEEAEAVGQMLRSLPVDQKATGIAMLAGTMTPQQGQALAGMIDKTDRVLALALGYGAAQTTQGRATSELILRGQEALKAKGVKLDDAAETGLTATIDAELRGAISNPEQLARVRDAARLIYAGKQYEGDRISIPGAIRLAVGGELVNRNGGKIVLPAGIDEDQFEQHLESYPAQALRQQLPDGAVYVRGQPVPADQFLSALPGAQLRTLGRGRYAVISGGAVATNAKGAPVIVEAPGAR